MTGLMSIIALLIFPGGLFVLACGLAYEWVDRKLVARLQNRVGPRWFQPVADTFKLLAKEEVVPTGVNPGLFTWLPIVALAGALTAALYVPMAGLAPAFSFPGDLIVSVYLLSLLTLCTGLAGANTMDRFSIIGAVRTLTQLFSYEAPFMLALLSPAIVAGSWQISEIIGQTGGQWTLLTQPVSFIVALIGL
uniref:complex I subunit 1 family protein n=1 Tax=Candidatus Roseilinea sp. TaxID=2838777 RepID=UPI00404B487A